MPKKTSAKRPAQKETATVSPAVAMEAMMCQLSELMAEGEAGNVTPDDLKALVASLSAPSASDQLSDKEADARNEAQQIAFDAMEAESEAQARKLAKRALKLDPDCVDALLVMANLDAHSPREAIERLQMAVAAGERSLGAKFIEENEGHFWLMLDTRPYMRALASLAEALRSQGIRLDAIRTYEKMLKLNPNDNQGVRDPLLGLYLETGDLSGAARLFSMFEEDGSANFVWARVLERFLAEDRVGAKSALVKARRENRHVELYLTSKKQLPEEPPEMYSPGSEEEAALCLINLSGAWAQHREAALWLFDQLEQSGASRAPSKSRLKRIPATGNRLQ